MGMVYFTLLVHVVGVGVASRGPGFQTCKSSSHVLLVVGWLVGCRDAARVEVVGWWTRPIVCDEPRSRFVVSAQSSGVRNGGAQYRCRRCVWSLSGGSCQGSGGVNVLKLRHVFPCAFPDRSTRRLLLHPTQVFVHKGSMCG